MVDIRRAEARDRLADDTSNLPGGQAHRMWVLAVLALAQLMIVLDTTVVTIALPSAQHDLGFTTGDRQWIITAYALSFGSLLLFCGRLTDLLGRKTTLIIGLVGFAVASAVGGAAGSFAMLVTARAVQGGFAALLAPSVLALLTTTFTSAKERGRAFGVFGAVVGSGAAVGLLLGGFLTEYLSWRWCLYVNLVFAVFALGGAIILIHRPARGEGAHLDVPGVLTVSAGLFALVYGFSNAVSNGKANWDDPATIGFLVAAAVLLVAFVVLQTRVRHPLLPLSVLAHRYRGPAFAALLLGGAGLFGALLFVTYYVQQVLGYTALHTGVAFLPMVACLMLASISSNVILIRRISPRILLPTGLTLAAAGLALLTRIGPDSTYSGVLLAPLIVIGLGLGMAFSTSINLATLDVSDDEAGPASASVNTAQQIGAAVGTALLNTLAIQASSTYLSGHEQALLRPIAAAKATLAAAKEAIAAAGAHGPAAVQAAHEKWSAPLAHATDVLKRAPAAMHDLGTHAAIASYSAAFWWGAALFLAGAIATLLLLRTPVPPALQHAPVPKEPAAQGEPAHAAQEPGGRVPEPETRSAPAPGTRAPDVSATGLGHLPDS
ncbi:MAG TPA: MFS transporter [Microbacteriaceae bacterium]|nr:MFS transporter [Microbacteriaceae bacterium]